MVTWAMLLVAACSARLSAICPMAISARSVCALLCAQVVSCADAAAATVPAVPVVAALAAGDPASRPVPRTRLVTETAAAVVTARASVIMLSPSLMAAATVRGGMRHPGFSRQR